MTVDLKFELMYNLIAIEHQTKGLYKIEILNKLDIWLTLLKLMGFNNQYEE